MTPISRAVSLVGLITAASLTMACGGCSGSSSKSDTLAADAPRRDAGSPERDIGADQSVDNTPSGPDYGPIPDIDVASCAPITDAGLVASAPSLSNVTFGSIVWSTELANTASKLVHATIAADGKRIYISGSYLGQLALDHKGTIVWKKTPQHPFWDWIYISTHLTPSGMLSLATTRAELEVRSLKDGASVWTHKLPGPYNPKLPNPLNEPVVTLSDGSLVVGGMARKNFARVSADGKARIFDVPVNGSLSAGSLVADGDRIFATVRDSKRLVSYDNQGQTIWQRSLGSKTFFSAALGPQRGLVTFGSPSGSAVYSTEVRLFDRKCGKQRWALQLDGGWLVTQTAVIGNDEQLAVLLHKRNTFMRIQTLSPEGNKLWRHDFEPAFGLGSFEDAGTLRVFGPVGADNALHVLRCQHTKTGFRNLLEAFDMKTGARLHRAELPFVGCVATQAVLLEDGLLVTVYQDGQKNAHVVALQTKSPGLAKTVWPTYCADNARSCNASIALAP